MSFNLVRSGLGATWLKLELFQEALTALPRNAIVFCLFFCRRRNVLDKLMLSLKKPLQPHCAV